MTGVGILELVTKTELARRIGISRQSIDKAIKKNKLRTIGEGRQTKIDVHDELTARYMNDNSSNRQVAMMAKGIDVNPEKSKEENNQNSDQAGESVYLRDEKTRLQTKKLKVELSEKMGELIQRKEVEKSFGLISSSVINYLFPLGDRLSPMLAGVFESTDQDKINEVKIMIDREVERALMNVKREIIDSL